MLDTKYPKIPGPYRRRTEGPDKGKLDHTLWATPEIGDLADLAWRWTEKIDGTNIRIIWDGHNVRYAGRTDAAQMPPDLALHLREKFPEDLVEQRFGETFGVLYGEGCGKGIQKGGDAYSNGQHFVLFDVRIGDKGRWLDRDEYLDIADEFEVPIVPDYGFATLHDVIVDVTTGVKSEYGPSRDEAEGLVGVTAGGFLDRHGHRIAVKVKGVDFP